ncbi:hypothetical protein IFM89_019570 [Coptis chinensis]|uniref:RRM domain-containing protein n=1 Tax=Coptis chinensis TaxID=261450 RepID=A0A835HCW8_9MAGN|nr:hypothetical protein IFM89_019570 [Coptis chinensis]
MEAFVDFFIDEKVVRVENIFLDFLKNFKLDHNSGEPFYESEIEAMKSEESTETNLLVFSGLVSRSFIGFGVESYYHTDSGVLWPQQYGDIRALYTSCKHCRFVMIAYYDIRAARNAMRALQNKPLRRKKLDIHYSIPKDTREPDLQDLFNTFGPVSRVYIAYDQKTGMSIGFGFVSFVYKGDADKAIAKLSGYGYDNLIRRVEWVVPRTN